MLEWRHDENEKWNEMKIISFYANRLICFGQAWFCEYDLNPHKNGLFVTPM